MERKPFNLRMEERLNDDEGEEGVEEEEEERKDDEREGEYS